MHVRQSEIAAGVAEGQFCVIEAQQLKNGRVKIVNVHRVFHRLEPKFIRGAVDVSAAHPAACQPH